MFTNYIRFTVASDTPDTQMDSALRELFYRSDRVPFVYWRRFSGARTTVLLIGSVAVLAFVTGLSHLSQGTGTFDGPLRPFLPSDLSDVVLFSGVLLGFLLGTVAVGLHYRKRLAWYGAVCVLPLSLLLPLGTAEPTDVLLFLLTLVTLPLVVRNRHSFDQRFELSSLQITALASFLAVQIYGTVGVYVMRKDYTGIETWIDAFYYIVVTGTTVGYGDATPETQGAKLFTLSVLIIGTATFGAVFGSLLVPALESRLTAAFGTMTASELALLEDHVLILGYGELTEPLLDELTATTDVVVVTPDTDTASSLGDRDINVLTADPTDEHALLDAGIETASGVVAATSDDAQDTLAVLAARQANPDIRVVAAATNHRHVDKFERIGVDEVISPAVIVGRRLGRSVTGDDSLSDATGESDDE
jgi:voltage-gated potassium channel